MPKHKVFVSYDHDQDVRYKNMLLAWDANPSFEFQIDSVGPDVAIDSSDAGRVKAALTAMMKDGTHILVLVGAKTATSSWVNWEIDRATDADVKLRLTAVKLAKDNSSPSGLLGMGTAWATSFERDRIVDALNIATNTYKKS